MKLSTKQEAALVDAFRSAGKIFQLPERKVHSIQVLNALVRKGLLKAEPVGTVWTLTETGRAALQEIY